MVAKNMEQLRQMLMKEMKKSMFVVSKKIEADMYQETGGFYTKGKPKQYVRTGALGDTPKTTAIDTKGTTVSFNAYLDDTHNYTTGTLTMGQVLERAESTHFRSGILGKPQFWERSESKMQGELDKSMKKFFKKA